MSMARKRRGQSSQSIKIKLSPSQPCMQWAVLPGSAQISCPATAPSLLGLAREGAAVAAKESCVVGLEGLAHAGVSQAPLNGARMGRQVAETEGQHVCHMAFFQSSFQSAAGQDIQIQLASAPTALLTCVPSRGRTRRHRWLSLHSGRRCSCC